MTANVLGGLYQAIAHAALSEASAGRFAEAKVLYKGHQNEEN